MRTTFARPGQCVFCTFKSIVTRPLSTSGTALPRQTLRSARSYSRSTELSDFRKKEHSEAEADSRTPHRNLELPERDALVTYYSTGPALGSSTRTPYKRAIDDKIKPRIWRMKRILRADEQIRSRLSTEEFDTHYSTFGRSIEEALASNDERQSYLLYKLRYAVEQDNIRQVDWQLRQAFLGHVVTSGFSKEQLEHQENLANLSYPAEWYPGTRRFRREFHVHVGPTNSGKTYHALKRLEEAGTGMYAGPLRLLAHEVYMRLNANGLGCDLLTGDEQRRADDEAEEHAPIMSCTVEMSPLNRRMDVAVIDEIQMMADETRGWAWTQAILGVQAKELHLCGEERAVPMLQEIAAMCGEKIHIHRYERLSPLKMMRQSLNADFLSLRKGDCLVAFSIIEIHTLRQKIEKLLNVKVAVIYGSLPPETRAQQAQLFNDPTNDYDILVASNAIGMGLNLNIKRIIFYTSNKFDGSRHNLLSTAEIKQIAGRAGRYSTADSDIKKASRADLNEPQSKTGPNTKRPLGLVTTLEQVDFRNIATAMVRDPEPIKAAGILPPAFVVERFAKYFPPETPFSYILTRLAEISYTKSRFFLCNQRSSLATADAIQSVDGLTATDRLIICAAPVETRKPGEGALVEVFARMIAESQAADITEIQGLRLELLEEPFEATRPYLHNLELLHRGVIIWNWLSYRFAGIFLNRELSMHVRELVERRIEETLSRLSFDYDRARRKQQAVRDLLEEERKGGSESARAERLVFEGGPEGEERGSPDAEPLGDDYSDSLSPSILSIHSATPRDLRVFQSILYANETAPDESYENGARLEEVPLRVDSQPLSAASA